MECVHAQLFVYGDLATRFTARNSKYKRWAGGMVRYSHALGW